MNDIWLDISNKIKDPAFLRIVEAVGIACDAQNVRYYLVGAAALDVIFRYGFDMPVARATQDFDFAVSVDSWDHYEQLREKLLTASDIATTKAPHRLCLTFGNAKFLLDLVPFGGLEDDQGRLADQPPTYAEADGYLKSFMRGLSVSQTS